MSWLLTITGREHSLCDPGINTRSGHLVPEIAHSLAQINRFTGHCKRPYSVAEHSLLVADLARLDGAPPLVQLAALMHDAHEAYVGDVASPIKLAVGRDWRAFEDSQAAELHRVLGLADVMRSEAKDIHHWDLVALATERRDLTMFDPVLHLPWDILDNPAHRVLPSSAHRLDRYDGMTWIEWRERFAAVYRRLSEAAADEKLAQTNSPPNCPRCGDNRQVWRNQITGLYTCHRAHCDTVITAAEPEGTPS